VRVCFAWVIAFGIGGGATPLPVFAQSPESTTAASASAETPVAAAERFVTAIGGLRWSDLSASIHPETLDLFRLYVTSIADADETGDFAFRVLGTRERTEVQARSSDRMFADLVSAIYDETPALLEVIATNSYTFLGHVLEGDTLAHVIVRVRPYTNGSAPTKISTVTVKRSEVGWRVLESPELEALSTAIRGLTLRPGDQLPASFD